MEASGTTTNGTHGNGKPPYGGFRTFWNFITQLSEHESLPQVLDRSIMGARGGSSRAELYIALKFFGLINEEKRPTPRLEALAADPSTDQLRALMEESYMLVIGLNLKTATPRQVDEMLTTLGATPATVRRSRTFFLHAAEAAGIEVGRLLKEARGPATAPRPRPRPLGTGTRRSSSRRGTGETHETPPLVAALVADLPTDGQWDEEGAKKWLTLFVPALAYGYNLDLDKIKVE